MNSSAPVSSSSSASSGPVSGLATGKGSLAPSINPASFGCVVDHGNWIFNAGVVEPAIAGCDPTGDANGVPVGEPTQVLPHLTAEAAAELTPSHRWWGSLAFYGDMPVGDTARSSYITPDPIAARISDRGVRLAGIPSGMKLFNNSDFGMEIPDPFAEVHEGIAIANSAHAVLDAKLHHYSDGSVTARWFAGNTLVMEGTFVYGSPYVYFEVFSGSPIVRTFAEVGPQKSTFDVGSNGLGFTTNVSGITNHFAVFTDGAATFNQAATKDTLINVASGRFTVAYLPVAKGAAPNSTLINTLKSYAQNRVRDVKINYEVNPNTQAVTVSHQYLNSAGEPITTLAGLMPLQWKNSAQAVTAIKTRSARGVVKFAETSAFNYQLPFVGLLPSLPLGIGDYDRDTLIALIREFTDQPASSWNTRKDTYWAGKNYGKVAELAAIAREAGLTSEADQLITWLKTELEYWFTGTDNGAPKISQYFVYDETWNTLLGVEESFGAQQQLNDHHFHYGYFVRAAAEICRIDASWCSADNYGPMVEMLIRDYAAGRDDSHFPYVRNFDPANGFSWASGHMNFTRGNNNESTSEAANAYGAMVLYGLITGNEDIKNRGIYLHASSTATYWEYWNNIDRYRGKTGDEDNFPAEYTNLTTSIIWGSGAVFSTWFSAAKAHILGIQGLPLSPLVFHIGLHADYMSDYAALGLSESPNNLPSGLPEDSWRDVWWNMLAMSDNSMAISDMESMNFNYTPEAGETKAHTYHWVYTLSALGEIQTGKGELTANYPAAVAFDKNGTRRYIAYNYGTSAITVRFSDGKEMNVAPGAFAVE